MRVVPPHRIWPVRQALRSVRRLARAGTPAAATELATLYTGNAGARVADAAAQALAALGDQAAVDAVCELAVTTGDERLRTLLAGAGHQPSAPAPRTLWLLLDGRADEAARLDYDGSLLRAACAGADAGVRGRVAGQIRAAGRLEWVRSLAGGPDPRDLEGLTAQEWDATAGVLTAARRWAEIWRLACRAPLPRAAALLRVLGQHGWQPDEAGGRLIALAGRCTSPPAAHYLEPAMVTLTEQRCELITSQGGALFGIAQATPAQGTLALWRPRDPGSGADPAGEIPVHRSWGMLAISPDGRVIADAFDRDDRHRRMRLLPLDGQPPSPGWPVPSACVTHLAFTPDSTLLTGWDVTGRVWVREVPSGRLLWSARIGRPGRACGLARAPGADLLATAELTTGYSQVEALGARIRLWRLGTGERLGTIELGTDGEVQHLSVSPDGSRVVLLRGACAEVWDPRSGTRVARHDLPRYFEKRWLTAAQTPDGRHAILGGTLDGQAGHHQAEVRRTADGELAARADLGSGLSYTGLVVSPDSRLLLLAAPYDGQRQIRAWHLPSGQPAGPLPGGAGQYGYPAFLADGSVVAMASRGDGHALLRWPPDPVLSGRATVAGCTPAGAARLRVLTAGGPDQAWGDLLDALVRWRHRYDIEAADAAAPGSGTDIEVD
jgi:WD40 repeat protein